MKKTNWKLPLIIIAGIIAIVLLCVVGVQSSQNKAFALEEQVNTAQILKFRKNAEYTWYIILQIA